MEGLRKITKNPSQDSRSPGPDFNPRPPEYEAEMRTIKSLPSSGQMMEAATKSSSLCEKNILRHPATSSRLGLIIFVAFHLRASRLMKSQVSYSKMAHTTRTFRYVHSTDYRTHKD